MGMKPRKTVDPVVVEMRDCAALLEEFGLQLHGFDPGVTAFYTGTRSENAPFLGGIGRGYWGEPFSFSSIEWKWLKPLLQELRDRRKAAGA